MNPCQNCKTHMKLQWINMHTTHGIPVVDIAKSAGVHHATIYRWLVAYEQGGIAALQEKSRAPLFSPNEYPDDTKDAMRLIRREALKNEKRYLGPKVIAERLRKQYGIVASASGIGNFLHNDGLIPEQRKRRRPKKERVRKCRIHAPGELVQLDVKYAVKSYADYWFFQYDAIDYVTAIVRGEIYPLQSNYESVAFLNNVVKRSPFSVTGIQTDNHSTFTNYYTGYKKSADPSHPRLHSFDLNCAVLGVTHYLIDPGKPAQNGKIERFHRTCEDEFYQREIFKDLNSLKRKFRDYLYYYNNEREHSANGYLTPLEKLRTFPGYEKVKEIA